MNDADAFGASVKLSYDDLDEMLKQAIRDGSVATRSYDLPDEADTEAPRPLSAAEADGQTSKLIEVMQPHPG
jgi:hypothetical protein